MDDIIDPPLGFLGLPNPTRPIIGGQCPDSGKRALANVQIDDSATLEMFLERPLSTLSVQSRSKERLR